MNNKVNIDIFGNELITKINQSYAQYLLVGLKEQGYLNGIDLKDYTISIENINLNLKYVPNINLNHDWNAKALKLKNFFENDNNIKNNDLTSFNNTKNIDLNIVTQNIKTDSLQEMPSEKYNASETYKTNQEINQSPNILDFKNDTSLSIEHLNTLKRDLAAPLKQIKNIKNQYMNQNNNNPQEINYQKSVFTFDSANPELKHNNDQFSKLPSFKTIDSYQFNNIGNSMNNLKPWTGFVEI